MRRLRRLDVDNVMEPSSPATKIRSLKPLANESVQRHLLESN